MAIEIERRFLVTGSEWKEAARGIIYRQGYLYFQEYGVLRIRIAGATGFLTLKMLKDDMSAYEYEYRIPLADAEDMLARLCTRPLVEKVRYHITFAGSKWEVDEFRGANAGLVIAEIELDREDQTIDMPPWVGLEVTGDRRYLNASLYRVPYTTW